MVVACGRDAVKKRLDIRQTQPDWACTASRAALAERVARQLAAGDEPAHGLRGDRQHLSGLLEADVPGRFRRDHLVVVPEVITLMRNLL